MFKKLKAEFKAALKIGKSRSKEDNRQLLTVDGSGDDSKAPAGLSRPRKYACTVGRTDLPRRIATWTQG